MSFFASLSTKPIEPPIACFEPDGGPLKCALGAWILPFFNKFKALAAPVADAKPSAA